MTEAALAPNPVILTDRAAKKIGRVLAKQPEGTVLRIAVAGGGCSGLQYGFEFDERRSHRQTFSLSKKISPGKKTI